MIVTHTLRRLALTALLGLLVTLGPAWAKPADSKAASLGAPTAYGLLAQAGLAPKVSSEEASAFANVKRLLEDGSLIAHWKGQGRVAGDIVELTLNNTTEEAIAVTLPSGTVLVLEDEELSKEFQPIILEETVTLLAPAKGSTKRMLRGYCLNYELLPPAAGRDFPYKFPENTLAFKPAIAVMKASLSYDAQKNVMPVDKQRTIVIQRAIWTALGQMTRDKLLEDIMLDAAAENKTLSKQQARRLADTLWDEVQRLLSMVR